MLAKFSFFILLFCALTINNYAQKNLKEASVVFNNGDTAKGYIDYKEWITNPSFILFTRDRNTATSRFGVNELTWFDVTGLEQFKRYTVRASLDNANLSALGDKDTLTEVRTVFLKILVTGKNVWLFSYRDKLKGRYYLQEGDGTAPVELLNTTYMINQQVSEEKQYRIALRNAALKYLPADKNILLQIEGAGYYGGEITGICLKLNGTLNSNIVTKTQKQPALRFFAGAGISQGALKFVDINYSGNSSPFYAPVADAGVDWLINPEVGRIVLRAQLHITSYKTDAYTFKDYTQYTEKYFFKFRQVNVALEPQLLYNLYNQKRLKWFVSAGAGLNFSSYPLNQQRFVRTSSTTTESTRDGFVEEVRKFWMNGCVSTGVDLDRLEFAFVYFPKSSITQTTTSGIDNTSMQLRVNFFIIK